MLENNLYVTLQHDRLLLLFSKQKYYSILFLAVPFLCRICELFPNVHAPTVVNLKEGYAATARKIRHLYELDPPEPLCRWTLYLISEECFKVVQVTQLAGLADPLTTDESLVAVEAQAVIDIIEVTHEEQEGANRCTRSPLPRIAVHDYNILRIS